MGLEWYILRDEKSVGPFSPSQMKQMADTGLLSKDDLVSINGTNDWRIVKTLIEPTSKPETEPVSLLETAEQSSSRQSTDSPSNDQADDELPWYALTVGSLVKWLIFGAIALFYYVAWNSGDARRQDKIVSELLAIFLLGTFFWLSDWYARNKRLRKWVNDYDRTITERSREHLPKRFDESEAKSFLSGLDEEDR